MSLRNIKRRGSLLVMVFITMATILIFHGGTMYLRSQLEERETAVANAVFRHAKLVADSLDRVAKNYNAIVETRRIYGPSFNNAGTFWPQSGAPSSAGISYASLSDLYAAFPSVFTTTTLSAGTDVSFVTTRLTFKSLRVEPTKAVQGNIPAGTVLCASVTVDIELAKDEDGDIARQMSKRAILKLRNDLSRYAKLSLNSWTENGLSFNVFCGQ